MANTKFNPSWKQHEKDIHSDDADVARAAADRFEMERNHEMRTDPQARRWEESRRKEVAKEKPIWKKEQLKKEKLREQKIIDDLKNGGTLMKGLKPAPGLIIIKPIEPDKITEGGIFVPDNVKYESNIAKVLRTSEYKMHQGVKEEAPCKEGDEILVREGAGLNIKIKGEMCLLIRFDEVFGVLEND